MAILTEKRVWKRESTRRARPSALTDQEQANVRRALAFLGIKFDSPAALAEALGMSVEAMWKARGRARPKTARLALIVSRVAGVALDDILSGAWPPRMPCPWCGR